MTASVHKLKVTNELGRAASDFRDLEPQICELERMAFLVREMVCGDTDRSHEMTLMLVEPLHEMAANLKKRFYRAAKAGN
jgi:hypothetical protein